jgi:hypothetical protein
MISPALQTSDPGTILLIFCLAIFIGVAIPATIYFWMRKENVSLMVDVMRKATQTARQPLKKTDDDLDELGRLVSNLKKNPPEEDTND